MANIQFGGLITGLDTNALIAGLVKAESRSIDLLSAEKVRYQAQDAVFTSLIGALGKLRSTAQGLSLSTDFSKKAVTSSNEAVLTATANTSADVGSFTIAVDSLARSQSVQSTSFTSATAAIGTGTLTINVGGAETTLTIDGTNNTLTGLKDAINDSNASVSASIINLGAETPDYRLVVQSNDTGVANAVTITSGLSGGSDPFAGGGEVVQLAANAIFSVNGVQVERASNKISDVISGVTFTLVAEGDRSGAVDAADPTAKISVAADSSALSASVQALVESYNAVNSIVNEQFAVKDDTKRQGSTAGDASLRGVIQRLRAELSTPGGNGVGVRFLSDIGISFQSDGSLALDEGKLNDAIATDAEAVSRLFLALENGIGKRIPDAVDDYVSQVDGALRFRQEGISQRIKRIDENIEREQIRIGALESRLVRQFSALEDLVSQLKSQGDFLAQQVSALQFGRRN